MKKIVLFIMLLLLIPNYVNAEELNISGKSSILIDYDTKKILYENNKDEKLPIASLTKMMGQIIILENIESGKIKWNDLVTVSKNASDYGGTQIYLSENEKMTVSDLFKGVSVASANDAIVALAEYISGSEEEFVKLMNEKVKELNLKNTNFTNPTGLDQDGNYSSAYDLALIAKELLKHNDILKYTSIYEDYLRENTDNKFWLVNTNKLIKSYPGCDGLKTGYTKDSLYSIAVTAKKDNFRTIGIILGESDSKKRNIDGKDLLDYGFNNYKINNYKNKNTIIDKYKINNKYINLVLKEDINILERKNEKNEYKEKIEINKIKLPINKNDYIGSINIYKDKELIGSYKLVSDRKIKKENVFTKFIDNLKEIIVGFTD